MAQENEAEESEELTKAKSSVEDTRIATKTTDDSLELGEDSKTTISKKKNNHWTPKSRR